MVEENIASRSRNPVVLQDTLKLYEKKVAECHVVLTTTALTYKNIDGKADDEDEVEGSEVIPIETIVGCHCMRDKQFVRCTSLPITRSCSNPNIVNPDTDGDVTSLASPNAYICVYYYPLKKKLLSKQPERIRKTVLFLIDRCTHFSENLKIAELWKHAIIRTLRRVNLNDVNMLGLPPPTRNLLIFVNPHSGPGKALQIFQQRVTSILAEADISYQLIITDRVNHARDYVLSADLKSWNGIVIVSGDGLLFEVLNGLMQRHDWRTAITMPIGIIPGGSGNGLARAVGYMLQEPYMKNAILCSCLNLVTGKVHQMDLVRVQNSSQVMYSFLSIGWGLLSDIDIESEKLRSLGDQRFALWAVKRIINLRSYKGRVSFLPCKQYYNSFPQNKTNLHPDPHSNGYYQRTDEMFSSNDNVHCSSSVSSCLSSNSDDTSNAFSALEECGVSEPIEIGCPAEEINSELYLNSPNDNNEILTQLPPLDAPVPSSWTVIEDEFILVYLAYQTHISSDCFFAPKARVDDGIMWLIMIKKGVTRAQILNFILAMESGEHTSFPYVETIPVQAVRIEPFTPGGYVTVDGEEVEYAPLQAEMLPSIARIMIR